MGCQVDIAKAIVTGGGDSILTVKGNQPTLHEGIVGHLLEHMNDDLDRVEVSRHETREKGHGREEHRTFYVLDAPAGLADARRWKGLMQLGVAVSGAVSRVTTCDTSS